MSASVDMDHPMVRVMASAANETVSLVVMATVGETTPYQRYWLAPVEPVEAANTA